MRCGATLMVEKLTSSSSERKHSPKHTEDENVSAPHLIKPPWKKQKDKTYRIRMTCGSILCFQISPQSRWITCRKLISEISKSTEQLVRLGWRRRKASSLSQWSKLVFGETSPPPTKSRGLHTSTQQALRFRAAGQRWSVSLCVGACVEGECRIACQYVWIFWWQSGFACFFSLLLVCFPSSLQKNLKKGEMI